MSEIPAVGGPSFHSKSETSSSRLATTPPLKMPTSCINSHKAEPQQATQKAADISDKAKPGSAVNETDQLFANGHPKKGAPLVAALKVLTQH